MKIKAIWARMLKAARLPMPWPKKSGLLGCARVFRPTKCADLRICPDHRVASRHGKLPCAKTIERVRRFLVKWISAQVKLLEPKPLRCFCCQVGNHVGLTDVQFRGGPQGLCFRMASPITRLAMHSCYAALLPMCSSHQTD